MTLVCVCNLSPVVRDGYRVGLPRGGPLARGCSTPTPRSTAAPTSATAAASMPRAVPWHGQPYSALELTLPPLGVLWLAPERQLSGSSSGKAA